MAKELPQAPTGGTNDYHVLPATEKQLQFARDIAARNRVALPDEVREDRNALSRWIDAHKTKLAQSRFDAYPSAKQIAFAERIARRRHREVPPECFKDKALMSSWIDYHK